MSSKLDLLTVAEGVETPEQVAMLEGNGCDVVQGYYFSKPLPLDDLKRFAEHPPYHVSPRPLVKKRAATEPQPSVGWSFTFETGHPEMDAQHMELVRILNQVGTIILAGGGAAEVRSLMKAFIDSARTHFSFEEELMNRHRYPEVKIHHELHVALLETLSSYDLQLKRNAKLDLTSLVESLSTWLIDHILHNDKPVGRFLQAEK
jgi:hemerythrin-like metal-binding protein